MTLSRRAFCALAPAAALARPAADAPLRFAICNETFEKAPFAEACRTARRAGFDGIEIAPFTLGPDPSTLSSVTLRECRKAMADEGIRFAGLHALLNAPAGLHVTTPDDAVRTKSWNLIRHLVDHCASLGGGVMIFGSGKNRNVLPGDTPAAALARFRDGLESVAPHAAARKVTILVEPLAPHLSNLINTLEQSVALVERINHPAIRTMFDTHNAAAETLPHAEALRKYLPWIRHVHLNEMDGRRPGLGSYHFGPILQTLVENHFPYWVSVEVFNFAEGGEAIATESMRVFRRELENHS